MISECNDGSKVACMKTLKDVVDLADANYTGIYRDTVNGKLWVVINNIPVESQSGIRGLAARYNDCVVATMTHDLNSARINVSELMHQIRNE
jgi:hypothetical protein